jgi:hypothetical protein
LVCSISGSIKTAKIKVKGPRSGKRSREQGDAFLCRIGNFGAGAGFYSGYLTLFTTIVKGCFGWLGLAVEKIELPLERPARGMVVWVARGD